MLAIVAVRLLWLFLVSRVKREIYAYATALSVSGGWDMGVDRVYILLSVRESSKRRQVYAQNILCVLFS